MQSNSNNNYSWTIKMPASTPSSGKGCLKIDGKVFLHSVGTGNTVIGENAFKSGTGSNNIIIGKDAGSNYTT